MSILNKKGSELTRTEKTMVRLDPRLKYLAELSARKQRRTMSSFIEMAVEQAVEKTILPLLNVRSITEVSERVWSSDEMDRFFSLVRIFPDLLNYEEQQLWDLIKEVEDLWTYVPENGEYDLSKIHRANLRKKWDVLKKLVNKEINREDLPDNFFHDPKVAEFKYLIGRIKSVEVSPDFNKEVLKDVLRENFPDMFVADKVQIDASSNYSSEFDDLPFTDDSSFNNDDIPLPNDDDDIPF